MNNWSLHRVPPDMDEPRTISTDERGPWSAALDLGARWFRARGGRRADPLGEHGHWDPARRDWRYHTHDSQDREERAS
jgi:hypothetical protein